LPGRLSRAMITLGAHNKAQGGAQEAEPESIGRITTALPALLYRQVPGTANQARDVRRLHWPVSAVPAQVTAARGVPGELTSASVKCLSDLRSEAPAARPL
jgi:hypothetical protein